ncbi:MAG: S41 family peptidase [Phycisphaerales bacterium]|jgi:carboxyl-terminal processing protease
MQSTSVVKAKPKDRKAGGPFWGPGRFLLVIALLVTVSASLLVLRERLLGLGRFAQAAAVLKIIEDNYVQETDPDELSRAAISGMLGNLGDPNSIYVPPAVAEQFNRMVMGADFVGIGVQVQRRDGFVTVTTPMAGTPAARAGVLPGDRIVAVDGVDTRELDTEEVTTLIAGPRGEAVTLTVLRGEDGAGETGEGDEIDLEIVRGDIRAESVKGLRRLDTEGAWYHALDDERGIGYVRITQFVGGTAEATYAAIGRAREQLAAQDAELDALILDLRSNPGGVIGEAVGVADLFIPGGPVVRTQDRQGNSTSLSAAPGVAFEGPIVVMIDGISASGSEIVAGAMAERLEDAKVLGTRTFGKASVQTVYGLPDGGTLKLTEAHYLLPSGRNLQRLPPGTAGSAEWGVDPSPGMHVALEAGDGARLAGLLERLDAVGGEDGNGGIAERTWDSAEDLLAAIDDPQLSAAHEALAGRLATGEWPRVGGDPITGERALRIEQLEQALGRMATERERMLDEIERLRSEISDDELSER